MLSADKFSLFFLLGRLGFFGGGVGGWGGWGGIDFSLGWFDRLKSTQIGGVENLVASGGTAEAMYKLKGCKKELLELQFHSHPISEL